MNKSFTTLIFIPLLLASNNLSAALYDRGDGFIYDDDLDITWLQDANYAKTSGYDADGLMTHAEATAWASSLSLGSSTNWRLPSAGTAPIIGFTENNGEMAHMFFVNLANQPRQLSSTNFYDANSSQIKSFLNIQANNYWTSNISDFAYHQAPWRFNFSNGGQTYNNAMNSINAWAVHDGDIANSVDVAAVPVPASVFLFSSALLGLMVTRRQTNP